MAFAPGPQQLLSGLGGASAISGAGTAALSATGWGLVAVAALQVWSGFQQAELMRDQQKLQNQINEFNAEFAELDAFEAEAQGFTESARYQSVISSTLGEQRVGFASQGVDVNYGTAAEVQQETKLQGYLNSLELQKQGREKARGFLNEARNIRFGGMMQRSQTAINASGVERSAVLGGLATGLSGYARK